MIRVQVGLVILWLLMGLPVLAAPGDTYPETSRALQERYVDEVLAHRNYNAYAKRAMEEGYPNIAHLFRSLAMSEAVHGRNFHALLQELKIPIPDAHNGLAVSTTRKNLKHASTVEAQEIDKEYPAILKRVRPEGHKLAIQSITWAWKAEQQHRDLIIQIRKAASYFFGLLVGRIEGEPSRYYVCQICGSTLTEIPAKQCPICSNLVHLYKEVPGYPGPAPMKPDIWKDDDE